MIKDVDLVEALRAIKAAPEAWLAAARIERLSSALQPFAAFADKRHVVPGSMVITSGSAMARTQLTMGDCYRAAEALEGNAAPSWKCKAQPTADTPQDCDWPWCGCDPHADKVIAAIQENDFAMLPMSTLRDHIKASIKVGAPGLADIMIDAIVRSTMLKVERGANGPA